MFAAEVFVALADGSWVIVEIKTETPERLQTPDGPAGNKELLELVHDQLPHTLDMDIFWVYIYSYEVDDEDQN